MSHRDPSDRDPDPPAVVDELRDLPERDDLTDPIRNRRRRTVIRLLDRLPPDATVEPQELARACAAVDADVAVHRVVNSDYRRAYDGLRQRDITQLTLAGVLERCEDGVGRGARFDLYAALLRAVDEVLAAHAEA